MTSCVPVCNRCVACQRVMLAVVVGDRRPLPEGRHAMRNSSMRKRLVLLSLSVLLVGVLGGASVATGSAKKLRAHTTNSNPNTITYAPSAPTFVGPAATGCASGCSLLTGPFTTTSTTSMSMTNAAAALNGAGRTGVPRALPGPTAAGLAERSHVARSHLRAHQPRRRHPRDSERQVRADRSRLRHDQHLGRRRSRRQGTERGRQRVADHQSERPRHRAARSGPVRGQRGRRRDQQHRRDPGVRHRAEPPVRTDPPRHCHGAHQPGMEQRRRPVVRVRLEQRRALVLHRDRLGEFRGQPGRVHRLLRRRRRTAATRASR